LTDALLDQIDLDVELIRLVDGVANLLAHATSPATRLAYQADLAHFAAWAAGHRLSSCRPRRRPWRCT
jgi:hypothetical protein